MLPVRARRGIVCDKRRISGAVGTRSPDLNLLPIMVALYDDLSVSGAGRRLGMSQPSVSKALRRLRDSFEDPLFVRGSNGLVPTPRAHAIVRSARPHLHRLLDDLQRGDSFDPAVSTKPITLAVSDIAEMAFFPSIVEHFRRHAPRCPITTVAAAASELAEGLEHGTIDIAAGFHPALTGRNFRKRLLSTHGFACLLRNGHPHWQRRLATADFLAAEHVSIRHTGGSQEVLERFIERRKLRLRTPVYTSHALSVPFIVMQSDLIATLPYAVVTRFASLTTEVRAALPPFDLTYELKLHWHRRYDNEPRSLWIREQLATVFKDHQWLEPPGGPAAFMDT
jgi:DNA-binding transcriptional LysR family regulator